MSDDREKWVLPRKTDEELNDLAKSVALGQVFITNNEDGIRNAFGGLLIFSDFTEEEAQQIGAMYEEYAKAGPRSINGYPFFFSASFVHVDDLPKLSALIEEKQKALEAL